MTNPVIEEACLLKIKSPHPESVADHLVSSDLAEVFKHLRIQFWARAVLITVVAATVPLFYAFLTRSNGKETWRGEFGIAALAKPKEARNLLHSLYGRV